MSFTFRGFLPDGSLPVAAKPHVELVVEDYLATAAGLDTVDEAVALLVNSPVSDAATALAAGPLAEMALDRAAIPYARHTSKQVRPLVSFYFDDALKSDLSVLKPIADAKGVPFSIAAISSYATPDSSSYLSPAELLQLQAEGWQIDSHSHTHAHLDTLTPEELDLELRVSRDTLRAMGLKVSTITYPYGEYNAATMRSAAKFFRAGLSSSQGTNRIPLRTHALRRVHMKDYTLEDMKARVDALGVGWLIFYGHSAPNWTQLDTDKLTGLIDYAQSKAIEIVTVDEALDAFENRLEVIDPQYQSTSDSVVVGADGRLYSPQVDRLNHVYLEPTGITNGTPLTDFPARSVTTVSFTTASGSGIALGQAGAGTLITYRVNDELVLGYQMFTPWASTPQAPAFRYWTGSGWGPWRSLALKSDVDAVPYRRMTDVNAFPSTAAHADFGTGVTMWDINSTGSAGYPATAGTVTMYRSNQGAQWSYQVFEQYQSANRFKRWLTNATTWSDWTAA